jgi:formate dehydrogenase major subunit
MVTFTLNGESITAPESETLLRIAEQRGIDIPRLCYMDGMRPDGNCRTCMVEIKGERALAPSCCRHPGNGMEVTTNSARAVTARRCRSSCCSPMFQRRPTRSIRS